jgi:hypothetical protein
MGINGQSQSMRLVLTRNASEVAVYIHEGESSLPNRKSARGESSVSGVRVVERHFRVEPSRERLRSPGHERSHRDAGGGGAQQAKELDDPGNCSARCALAAQGRLQDGSAISRPQR